jgi:hypothetical protein
MSAPKRRGLWDVLGIVNGSPLNGMIGHALANATANSMWITSNWALLLT